MSYIHFLYKVNGTKGFKLSILWVYGSILEKPNDINDQGKDSNLIKIAC